MTLQVLQWPTHQTFGILSHLFISDYIYDSWTLDLSGLCVEEHHKRHTHKQRRAVCTVLRVLSEINISFALLHCLDADWHPFLRGQLRDMHTCAHTHSHTANTHTLCCSGPAFALTDASAVQCWHLSDTLSLSDEHHCLPTTLSRTPHVSLCVCLCVCVCVSSMLVVYYQYTLPSFHFYIAVYTFNQSQTVCVPPPLCFHACACIRMLSLCCGFFLGFFFWRMVVCRCVQTRSGEQWCCCNPVNRHSV